MFQVVLLDKDGHVIVRDERDTMKEAKAAAKHLLSDDFANICETTHAEIGTKKAEILNSDGECVADYFLA